jgi:hypothetical protein
MTIAPFVTYRTSVLGQAVRDIRALAPKANLIEGLPILGERAANAKILVDDWLCRLGLC